MVFTKTSETTEKLLNHFDKDQGVIGPKEPMANETSKTQESGSFILVGRRGQIRKKGIWSLLEERE